MTRDDHGSAAQARLVPLSRDRHATRRWRKPPDFRFAQTRQLVPLVLAEIESAASALPLVFAESDDGQTPLPVALLRLTAAKTAYVTPDGRWLAPYIPAPLRVYPFSARPAPQQATDAPARLELWLDEASGLVSDNADDLRFFDPYGAPSPALEAVIKFFRQYEKSAAETRSAMQALAAARTPDGAGLFITMRHGETEFPGLLALDRARFEALDDAAFLALRASGALSLAFAHLVSRTQLNWLSRAERALSQAGAPAPGQAPAQDGDRTAAGDISDFLSALASARNNDMLENEWQDTPNPTGRK